MKKEKRGWSVVIKPPHLKLLMKLASKVQETSLNQVKKDLGLGSHNTISYWFRVGRIPLSRHDKIKTYLGVK